MSGDTGVKQARRIVVSAITIAATILAVACHSKGQTTTVASSNGIGGIVTAFDKYPVVIIGESHWLQQAGAFYIELVRDHSFQAKVDDIVVEFASRQNQELLDRYIGGEDVSVEEVRHIWRDTTKVASWESPIYANWLAAIRDVNKVRPPGHRLRVLAGDTAVDWSHIETRLDYTHLGDNVVSFANVVETEVLAQHHHALVVLGANHVRKTGDRAGNQNATTLIESRYPGSTFVVLLDTGFLDHSAEKTLEALNAKPPALFDTDRPPLSAMRDRNGAKLSKIADAILYLASPDELKTAAPPAGSLEPSYLKEIDRRSMIQWGELRARQFLGPAGR